MNEMPKYFLTIITLFQILLIHNITVGQSIDTCSLSSIGIEPLAKLDELRLSSNDCYLNIPVQNKRSYCVDHPLEIKKLPENVKFLYINKYSSCKKNKPHINASVEWLFCNYNINLIGFLNNYRFSNLKFLAIEDYIDDSNYSLFDQYKTTLIGLRFHLRDASILKKLDFSNFANLRWVCIMLENTDINAVPAFSYFNSCISRVDKDVQVIYYR